MQRIGFLNQAPAIALDTDDIAAGKTRRNMDHLCLRIEPFDQNALVAHLVSHGVAVGEIHSRFGADGYGPSLYINDPEGNVVELKGPPTRAGKS